MAELQKALPVFLGDFQERVDDPAGLLLSSGAYGLTPECHGEPESIHLDIAEAFFANR